MIEQKFQTAAIHTQRMLLPYCADVLRYQRRETREVMVGKVGVGGNNPIRVQSMTTTLTQDVAATTAQVIRLVEAGCEIVRITAPTPKDSRAIGEIRQRLEQQGLEVPLVADIHYSPAAALAAVPFVEKVRINPGNYADVNHLWKAREYSDAEYAAELARIEERVTPLVLACRQRGIAMRIGANHGSLSDRIMNRYGDTPLGMVESALEFVRICEKNGYYSIILSMKSSNPKVMVEAYRLLVARMDANGMNYPLHLGVTEAGNGEDARIKSAIGIGALLEDGLGDTIRVSLAEEPEEEVPVAFSIARRYPPEPEETTADEEPARTVGSLPWDPYSYTKRASRPVQLAGVDLGGEQPGQVLVTLPGKLSAAVPEIARQYTHWQGLRSRRALKPDLVVLSVQDEADLTALGHLHTRLALGGGWPLPTLARVTGASALALPALQRCRGVALPVTRDLLGGDTLDALARAALAGKGSLLLELAGEDSSPVTEALDLLFEAAKRVAALGLGDVALGVNGADSHDTLHRARRLALQAAKLGRTEPLHISAIAGPSENPASVAGTLIATSIAIGTLLCDGLGDSAEILPQQGLGVEDTLRLTFNTLQAAGSRLTKTDYVACPSCGRTLFDLQTTTERIKQRTSHLVGVKIAIMGCIVNGPGEMADADFGYVGGSPDHVNLYVGKQCVEKNVPASIADERLVELIKAHGKWQEPDSEQPD